MKTNVRVKLLTVCALPFLDIVLSSTQHGAGFLGLFGRESWSGGDLDIEVLEGEVFSRRQSTTERDEAFERLTCESK